MLSTCLCLNSIMNIHSGRCSQFLEQTVVLGRRSTHPPSCPPVQIPVPPSATSRLLYELLDRVRLGFLVVSPFRIACVFLHVEPGQSSKRVWRSPRIIYLLIYFLDIHLVTSSNIGCMGRFCAEDSQSIWFYQGLSSSLFPSLRHSPVSVLVIQVIRCVVRLTALHCCNKHMPEVFTANAVVCRALLRMLAAQDGA
jgi:hypothetical protein